MAYTPGTITGTFQLPNGEARTGTAYVRLQVPQVRDQEGEVIFAGTVSADLVDGAFSIETAPSDDETLDPSGATYLVDVRFDDGSAPKLIPYVSVPSGGTVDVSSVGTLDPAAPTYQQWVNEAAEAAALAEAAATAAATVSESATTAAEAAETARLAALAAQGGAVAAQGVAVDAQSAAETAQAAAEAASATAGSAASAAATAAVAPLVADVAAVSVEVAGLKTNASSWPIYNYGASYSTLNQAFFTAGRHWSQILAEKAGAGAVTSYGVNGRRALDVVLALLQGQPMSGITGIVAGAKWPGVSGRNGLIVHDAPGNDVMNQAAMNGASITVAAITGTNYINYLKQHYRAALALMSSESRIENHSHTATSGTWTHSSAGTWASGGDTCFTTEVGASADYSITPPQRGPLAGRAWVFLAGDLAAAAVLPNVTIAIDGGAPSAGIPSYKHTYTGQNGTQVKGFVNAIPVTLPVDGAAHTIRVAHAGSAGQFMVIDVVTIASEDPNPILCMGLEHQLATHASGLTGPNLLTYHANLAKVTAAYKEVVAEFPNAIYVPSTVTANGLWSGDGIHLNDRGNLQRANDAAIAVRGIKARLDNRAVALQPDGNFGII